MRKEEPLTESYFYILLCLWHQPLHGYGIMQMTSQITSGRVVIGSGTMYGATGKMIKKGWIQEIRSADPEDERRRLYGLTKTGRDVLRQEVGRLKEQADNADKILGTVTGGRTYGSGDQENPSGFYGMGVQTGGEVAE